MARIDELCACAERWSRIRSYTDAQWKTCRAALEAALSVFPKGSPLLWSDEACALITDSVANPTHDRIGIRVGEMTLVVLDDREQPKKTMPLLGRPATEATQWLQGMGVETAAKSDATVNEADSDVCTALERWFGNGQSVLGHVSRITHGATPPRFDIETMKLFTSVQLPSRSGEPERSVRVAFAWDEKGALPEMNVHVEPSAITIGASRLGLREIDVQRDRDAQGKTVQAYIAQAVGDGYAALDREWRRR